MLFNQIKQIQSNLKINNENANELINLDIKNNKKKIGLYNIKVKIFY